MYVKDDQQGSIIMLLSRMFARFLPNKECKKGFIQHVTQKLAVGLVLSHFLASLIAVIVFNAYDIAQSIGYIYQAHLSGILMMLVTVNACLLLAMLQGFSPKFSSILSISNFLSICMGVGGLYGTLSYAALIGVVATVCLSFIAVYGSIKGAIVFLYALLLSTGLFWLTKGGYVAFHMVTPEVKEIVVTGIILLLVTSLAFTLMISDYLKSYVAKHYMHLAMHDELTGLVNRRYFSHRVMEQMSYAKRNGKKFGVIYLDVNDFKRINDTFGHDVGDLVLKSIAVAMSQTLRLHDVGARIGGDEFAILAGEIESEEDLEFIMSRIRLMMCNSVEYQGKVINISSSIGASIFPTDSETIEGLLNVADKKMYLEKELKNQLNGNLK